MSDDTKDKIAEAIDEKLGAGTADKVEGKAKEIIGKGKEAVGTVTGNAELKTEGKAEQAEGVVQRVIGEAKEVAGLVAGVAVEGAYLAVEAAKNLLHPHSDEQKDEDEKPAKP